MEADLIRRMFAAIDGGRFDDLSSFFAPDVVYERPGYAPLEGLAALEHFYRHVRIIEAGTHALHRVVYGHESAAAWGRFTGRSRHGAPLDERFADVYELRDGKVARRVTHFFRAAI